MSHLLQLPAHLREKIINKAEWKSYFRLQQTCHDMADFYRVNQKVTVCLPHSFRLQIIVTVSGRPAYYSLGKPANLDSLYGVRFNQTTIRTVDCYITLKKYRITSKYVDTYRLKECSSEDYEKLLKTMKPMCVNLDSRSSNRFEVFLNVKTLKNVMFTANIDDIQDISIIQDFLLKFHQLDIILDSGDNSKPNFNIVTTILQYLRSVPLQNLRCFTFSEPYDYGTRSLPSPEEFLELFHDSSPILLKTYNYAPMDRHRYVFECRLGDDRYCELKIGSRSVDIRFKAVDRKS